MHILILEYDANMVKLSFDAMVVSIARNPRINRKFYPSNLKLSFDAMVVSIARNPRITRKFYQRTSNFLLMRWL